MLLEQSNDPQTEQPRSMLLNRAIFLTPTLVSGQLKLKKMSLSQSMPSRQSAVVAVTVAVEAFVLGDAVGVMAALVVVVVAAVSAEVEGFAEGDGALSVVFSAIDAADRKVSRIPPFCKPRRKSCKAR
mmetsp:Transcript_31469/g.47506  ORF Transcript_31469/g.47506 Transcript_31469/m.47506 type:complete len:128 (+) Transcript_31469:324-707(+)